MIGKKELSEILGIEHAEVIGEIILPKKYDSVTISTEYVLDEKSKKPNKMFAQRTIQEIQKNPEIVKDAYEENGKVKIELNDCKMTKNMHKAINLYFSALAGGFPRRKLSKEFISSLEGDRLEAAMQNGEATAVNKSPQDITSIINQNITESAPFYTTSEAVNKRERDIYRI